MVPRREFALSAVDVARPPWIAWHAAVRLLFPHLSTGVVQRALLPGKKTELPTTDDGE